MLPRRRGVNSDLADLKPRRLCEGGRSSASAERANNQGAIETEGHGAGSDQCWSRVIMGTQRKLLFHVHSTESAENGWKSCFIHGIFSLSTSRIYTI